jgi:phage gp29-like protein
MGKSKQNKGKNTAVKANNALNAKNVYTHKKQRDIQKNIVKTSLYRQRAQVNAWIYATQTAESIISPNNTELMRVYKDIEVDLHLFALMQTIRLKVIANNFFIYDASGEINEELTDLFKKKWFRKTTKYIIDSEFYGFSLIQFADIKDGIFSDATLVPREYVVQQKGGIKTSLANTKELIAYDTPEFLNWVIPVGETDNLGLLHKAAPIVIKKKEVVSAWSEAAEIFGMPLRLGKTNIGDPERRSNMEEMLDNMGTAAWGVFGEDDSVEFVEGAKSDFFKIYQEFINTANAELSKGFLLQTGTTDEKAYAGSAGVHESVLKTLIEAYIVLVEEVTNEFIIPACQRLGLLPVGAYFQSDNEQKLSFEELTRVLEVLLASKEVPNDWIETNFGIPVEDKIIEAAKEISKAGTDASSVMKAVKNMYSGTLKTCKH